MEEQSDLRCKCGEKESFITLFTNLSADSFMHG